MPASAQTRNVSLQGLEITGGQLQPAFDEDTSHYALRCDPASSYRFTLSTDADVSVNGHPADPIFTMANLDDEDDIVIELSDGSDSGTYVVHCIPERLPDIVVETKASAEDGLVMLSGISDGFSYAVLIDDNGVPRFQETSVDWRLWHFKRFANGKYGYTLAPQERGTEGLSWNILTSDFEIERTNLQTGPSLALTGGHDLLIKDNGNFIFMAYEPANRDFSAFTDDDDTPYSTTEMTRDSVIQEVTPNGVEVMTWNSWDHLALEDCWQHRFPDDYAHVNSLFLTDDGDLLASFRGCSQVALIDWQAADGTPGTGELLWLAGKSNKTDWTIPRLAIKDDPYGEFCGQHAASITSAGNLLLFDNGGHCLEDATGATTRDNAVFSRAVEYKLDVDAGTATFVRHVSQHGTFDRYSYAAGEVLELDNGNWLISWGWVTSYLPQDAAISEVDPATGMVVMTVKVTSGDSPNQIMSYSSDKVVTDPPLRPGPPPTMAEIAVEGNGTNIAHGRHLEDFGSVPEVSGTRARTYTIRNTGAVPLLLSGTPRVAVSGTHAGDFRVSAQPAATVAAGGSTTFTVTFDPSGTGTRTATLSIENNDADENPFNFGIRGTGTRPLPPPPPPPPPPPNRPPVVEREIAAQTLDVGEAALLDLDLSFHDPDQSDLDYTVAPADAAVASVEVEDGTLTLRGTGRGRTTLTVSATDPGGLTASQTVPVTVLGPALLGWVPSASDPLRQGFVRVVNRAGQDAELTLEATDDTGRTAAPVTLTVAAGEAVQLNSGDLEAGNPAKGLADGVGEGEGDWRVVLDAETDFDALAYVRTAGGLVTAMHDRAPFEDGAYRVAFFNPGSNRSRVSLLRVVNPGEEAAAVTVTGIDARGDSPGSAVGFEVPAGAAVTVSAAELEAGGEGLTGALGDGEGKWRLRVASDRPLVVMSLLSNRATGHVTNLSTVPAAPGADGVHRVPFFPAAADAPHRQGFVRVINRAQDSGTVTVEAFDDLGGAYAPLTLSLAAGETVHFNSHDLEEGNPARGLTGATGAGEGAWRLALASDLDIEVLAYLRTRASLTSMHEAAPLEDGAYRVAFFNPASNRSQVSALRLVNAGEDAAAVSVTGIDSTGVSPGSAVALTVPARGARTVSAADLEAGGEGLTGALGDGQGKWRLRVASDRPLMVMSLLSSPTGHLANLSTAPASGLTLANSESASP